MNPAQHNIAISYKQTPNTFPSFKLGVGNLQPKGHVHLRVHFDTAHRAIHRCYVRINKFEPTISHHFLGMLDLYPM